MSDDSGHMSKHFSIERLEGGVYAAIHTDGGAAICNAGLINLGNLTVVFDTFLTAQAARDLLFFSKSALGGAPQLVINSHYHNDHTWGNQAFTTEAQIISSVLTRQLFETEGRQELDWYKSNSVKQLQDLRSRFEGVKDEQERKGMLGMLGYYEGLVESMPNLKACKAGITFDGKMVLHGEMRSAELITFERAHTASDTVLFLPSDGVVFMGDLLFVKSHPYLCECNPSRLIEALKAISSWGANKYVPGHGGIGTCDDVSLLVEYLEYCIRSTRDVIKEGSGKEELKRIDIPEKFRCWHMPHMFGRNLEAIYDKILSADF